MGIVSAMSKYKSTVTTLDLENPPVYWGNAQAYSILKNLFVIVQKKD